MKVLALKNQLREGLEIAQRVATKSPALPVLGNILLSAKGGEIQLAATDLQMGITYQFLGTTQEGGRVVFDAHFLSSLLAISSGERVSLATEGKTLSITTGDHEATLKTVDEEEFPIIPSFQENDPFFEVETKVFCDGLNQVVGMTGQSQARPEISGVFFRLDKKTARAVATDSFRLAEYTIDLEQEVTGVEIIIPTRAVHELVRILLVVTEVGAVTLVASNNQVYFKMGDTDLVTRLIEASYPDYKKVIPTSFVTEVVVSTEEIANALRMASIFTTNQANNVHFKIDDQEVRLTSAASQHGQEVTALTVEVMHHTEEKSFDVAFNTRYLLDAVNAAGGTKQVIKFSGPTSPAVVVNPDIPPYQHIVMPIRLNS